MKVKLDSIINAISIQNQLLVLENSILEDFYSTEDNERIIMFIDGCNYLLKNEKEFFLLEDNIINKVFNIILKIRFEHRECSKEYNKDLNGIIVEINKLINLSKKEKTEMINEYIDFQEDNRNSVLSHEAMLCCISYDAILFEILENGNISNIDNMSMLVSSINYFFNVYPDIFKNEIRRNNLKKLIEFIKDFYVSNNDINLKEYMDITCEELARIIK